MSRLAEDTYPPFKEDGILTAKKFGYGSGRGAGSTVTQLTNRATGVTINALAGQITTINSSLAAEASAVFTVTNNKVAATDVVNVCMASGSVALNTDLVVSAVAAGSFAITVVNNNAAAGTAETGAIVINFVVIKGATT
jgi:hypothetical protein